MEDLLLVLDEIDDLFSIVAMKWRSVASFLIATLMFIATGFLFLSMPITVEVIAFALVGLGLVNMVRERRHNHSAASIGL
jgi:hypothetical protein